MFRNLEELVNQAREAGQPLSALMIDHEAETSGQTREAVVAQMARRWQVMVQAARRGVAGVEARSGMTGGDAKRLWDYVKKGRTLTGSSFLTAISFALGTNEVNAAMGVICATPTAGSSGVLPGVLLMVQQRLQLADEAVVQALFTAAAVGYAVANNAVISGAQGGCQAEVGTASAMAAAAAVELAGGSPQQCADGAAMALKNLLGLACDPLAGLVEVPCIKRNAGGAAIALAAADMALAGIRSQVPVDEVIAAMYQIGQALPLSLKETAQGGLAATPTGCKWKELLWNS
ncbi:MAG: L-serine ammonia-lyase, iron-sulfur-dependent, subunit alpha [Clostridiales bacterium]|jgi:L-serine dehydratase|nr:L-serine ammonia-lyase, iron-sulfur-dependent, subunit alpha [Clostridiales bacterium]